MWKYNYIPNSPITIKIELISPPLDLPPSHIKIWNYNDINLLGAGVKKLEIKYDEISIIENTTIKRATGSEDSDYSIDISLLEQINNINPPNEIALISPIEHELNKKKTQTISTKDILLSPVSDNDRKSPVKTPAKVRPNSSKDNELNRSKPLENELNNNEKTKPVESTLPIEKTKTIIHTPVHSEDKTISIHNNNPSDDNNKVDASILLELLPKPNYDNDNKKKSNTSPIISPSHNKPRPHRVSSSSTTTSNNNNNNGGFDIHKLPPSHPGNNNNNNNIQPINNNNTPTPSSNNLDSTMPLDLPKHSPTSKASSRPNTQSNNMGGTAKIELPKDISIKMTNNNNLGSTSQLNLPKESKRITTPVIDLHKDISTANNNNKTPLKPNVNDLGSTSQLNLPKESKRLSTPIVDLPKDISIKMNINSDDLGFTSQLNLPKESMRLSTPVIDLPKDISGKLPSKRPPTSGGGNKPLTPPISNNNNNDLGKTTQLDLPTDSRRLTTPIIDLPKDISIKISTSPERVATAALPTPIPSTKPETPYLNPATPMVNLPREYQRLTTPHVDLPKESNRLSTPIVDLPKDISIKPQSQPQPHISPKKRNSLTKRILSPTIPPIGSPNLNETLPLFKPDTPSSPPKRQSTAKSSSTPKSKPSTALPIDIQNTPQSQQHQSQSPPSFGIDIHMARTPLINNPSQSILDNVIYNKTMILDTMPHGHSMEIALHSTWGDPYYIGLNGIEFYDENGHPIRFRNPKNIPNQNIIKADPSDINVLPDYNDDPRVITNLLDGINYTTDDYHIWLSPYYVDKDNFIYINFDGVVDLSMMRIWNYNKCRTHSTRGARSITVKLDNNIIYNGDIKQAPGTMANIDECRESLYFTNDPMIRNEIEQYDKSQILALDRTPTCLKAALEQFNLARPSTAEKRDISKLQQDQHHRPKLNLVTFDGRPFTAVGKAPMITPGKRGVAPKVDATPPKPEKKVKMKLERTKLLCLELLENYGDKEYIGLTGIAVMKDSDTNLQKLTMNMISSSSNVDTPTLFNLINGINKTTNPNNMCLIKIPPKDDKEEEKAIKIFIDFKIADFIGGLLIWNYNKSEDDLPIGVKRMNVYCDEKLVSPPGGFILRPGYGITSGFDFVQKLYFHSPLLDFNIPKDITINGKVTTSQYYTTVLHPFGTSIKINLNESHGDPFYIGLNEIDFYDINNNKIYIKESQIFASPYSVNILPQSKDDLRIPSNLVDGKISSDKHSWLSPLARTMDERMNIEEIGGVKYITNSLYFLFDKPIILSYIKIWNYHKTPKRGAKDIEIWMDNTLLYKGWLNDSNTTGSNGQTIVFTNNFDILSKEKNNVFILLFIYFVIDIST